MGSQNSRELSEEEIDCLGEATGIEKTKILEGWETFKLISDGEEALDLDMVKQIVPSFIGELKEPLIVRMFEIFDEDKNGLIDFKEFMIGTTIMNLKDPKALARLIYKVGDKDNSDGIDHDEFEKLGMIYVDHCPNVIMLDRDEFKKQFGQVVNEIFKKYDQEKKGYLNESEFTLAFEDLQNDAAFSLENLEI